MELTYVTIIVLASMIFILAGMTGYLYWQQTKLLQYIQSLSMALAAHVEQCASASSEEEEEEEEEEEGEETNDDEEEEDDDDRVSVESEDLVEIIDAPPPKKAKSPVVKKEEEDDEVSRMTVAELKKVLTDKGIPFGKRDTKPVLIQLFKASQ